MKDPSIIFSDSLEQEKAALDLVLASKLDSFICTLNLPNARDVISDMGADGNVIVYKSAALSEYAQVLSKYFELHKKCGENEKIVIPPIDFSVVNNDNDL
jgi:hypothetical protein